MHRYHAIAGRVTAGSDVVSSEDEDVRPAADGGEQVFSCPELLHNLDMLIEETEQKILSVSFERASLLCY